MKQTNTADLHLQYKMETGEWFQWDNSKYNENAFHGTEGFTYDYTKWLEEQLLLELQKKKKVKLLNDLLEEVEEELEKAYRLIDTLEDDIEALHEKNAGPAL